MPAKSRRRTSVIRPPRVLRGTVTITRQVHFNAAHRLHNPTKSQAWNEQRYGRCTNPHWHGHNYVLEVTLRGEPDPETGYIVDLSELKRVLHRTIVEPCDHRNLNEEVEFLRGIIPSTENLVIAFWQQIEPALPAGMLHCVRLYETPRNFAEYFGPESGRAPDWSGQATTVAAPVTTRSARRSRAAKSSALGTTLSTEKRP